MTDEVKRQPQGSRKIRGAKIHQISYIHTRTTVPLRLDRKAWEFVAYYAGEEISAQRAEPVIEAVLAIICQHQTPGYRPLIYVQHEPQVWRRRYAREADGFEIALDRFYFAVGKDNRLYKLAWDDYEAEAWHKLRGFVPWGWDWGAGAPPGRQAADFDVPYSHSNDSEPPTSHHYPPYSEEVWQGLLTIVDATARTRERLGLLLADAEALRAVGAGERLLLLGSGDDTEQ